MFIIDIPTIITLGIIYSIIDFVIFKLFRIKQLTLFIAILADFIIPILWIWWLPQSGLPFAEQLPIFLDKWMSMWINLFNFVISGAIGLFVSVILCILTGEKEYIE